MERWKDGFGWGLLIGVIVIVVVVAAFGLVYGWGLDRGRVIERESLQQQGLGRYIEVKLDDRNYTGWLR